ncbi:MMPL family transporter [Salicibibacter halophilus]|uniref:MMPL family transporter n=1 Tax=Salicibibacter halophilus TaxID=2502791 RepID=A0A514LKG4_9BACI|nr:MMPL family transporter [Salicibibacter halophilus]QDI92356.1 MMPL family transporter [Salicibibacter halophilus]
MLQRLTGKTGLIIYPIVWALLASVLFLLAPDMEDLVREEGQVEIPEAYPTQQFEALIEADGGFSGEEVIIAYYEEEGLSRAQADGIEDVVEALEDDSGELPLYDIVSPFDGEQQEEQLVSEEEELFLVMLEMDLDDGEYEAYRGIIDENTEVEGLAHYQTGAPVIEEDLDNSTQEGLVTAQWITVALVFIVLLSIFRSPIAPILPLFLLGTAYIFSIGIVAFLIEGIGFPVSNYTQIFIMAVVFGVGTDYCILLMRRFQEEMPKSGEAHDAMLRTFRASTKTVLYGVITGFIGFATIGFADFDIYQSGVGVAVAMVVLAVGIWAWLPSMMSLVGNKMFWPSKPKQEQENNWLWTKLGTFSVYRPGFTLVLVAIILVPLFFLYDNDVSFDNVEEIPGDYDSIMAYDLIADTFGEGDIFFTTLAVEAPEGTWENANALPYLEMMALNVEKAEGVDDVRTITRPEGERTDAITIPEQAEKLTSNLEESIEGLEEVSEGHEEMLSGIAEGAEELSEAEEGVQELIQGTDEALSGVEELEAGLTEMAGELEEAEAEVWEAYEEIEAYQDTLNNIEDAAPGMETVEEQLENAETARQEALAEIAERQEQLQNAREAVQALAFDPSAFEEELEGRLQDWRTSLEELNDQLEEEPPEANISDTVEEMITGMEEGEAIIADAVDTLYEVEETRAEIETELGDAQEDLADIEQFLALDTPLDELDVPSPEGIVQEAENELTEIQDQVQALAVGMGEAVDGLEAMHEGVEDLDDGLQELQEGHEALSEGLNEAEAGLDEIEEGLQEADEGTLEVIEGLESMQSFTEDMAGQPSHPLEGIFISDEMMEDDDFDELWDHYATPDEHVVSLVEVTMEDDPYGFEAIETVERIEDVAAFSLQETPFEDATILADGIAAENRDLNDITTEDFMTTAAIMLAGIFLALSVLFRSLIIPMYVLFSLVAAYFGAAAVTEWIFTDLANYDGLMWAVPFFGFVLLMALGVDYSIFLLTRFNETREDDPNLKTAMIEGMKKVGGTVLSAALILGGTFASMMASGVLTLMQISTLIVLGLLFYSFVLLPLFVPAVATLLGEKNWWPFKKRA